MKDERTEEWLSVIERIMVINLKGRRADDMDELQELLARLDALNKEVDTENRRAQK